MTPAVVPKERGRKTTDNSIREIVLEIVGTQPTFRLAPLIDRIIESGQMTGDKKAIYGSVTVMLRRNSHIFKKVRRGIYRVARQATTSMGTGNEESQSDTDPQNGRQEEAGPSIH